MTVSQLLPATIAHSLPENFAKAREYFSSDLHCVQLLASRRWAGGHVLCPVCGAPGARFLASRNVWECRQKHPKRQFSVRAGTLLEESHLPLEQWLDAIWILANAETRVSSYELARRLRITQKSAWFMLRRIKCAFRLGRAKLFAESGLRAECKAF